jgi:hypothetical protein
MPWSRVLTFADPLSYLSAFRSVEGELFPIARRKFSAELTQVSMNKLWIHRAHEDLPRVHIGMVKPHRAAIGFLARADQAAMQHCGMEVFPGDIAIDDNDLMYRRTEANGDWGSMSLPRDDLNAACKAVTGHDYAWSSLKPRVRPSPDLMSDRNLRRDRRGGTNAACQFVFRRCGGCILSIARFDGRIP